MISRFDNVGEAETMESKYFLARYRNPVALGKQGRNSWGTTAALLHAWQQAKWPFLPDDVAFSMHGYLSQCTSCFFGTAQPATLLRGARVFRTDCQAQCVGCVPHTWCEEKQRATRSHTYKPAPNCTRAHTFRDMWNEVPLEDVESSLQNTFRLVLFPVTDLSIVDTVMSVAPIREVTVRQGAVLYDLSRWLTPRITRLSLHSAPCVTDHAMLLLCGHVKHLRSLHLVSVPNVSMASFAQLIPELDDLEELVVSQTAIVPDVLLQFTHKASLRALYWQPEWCQNTSRSAFWVSIVRHLTRLDDFTLGLRVLDFNSFIDTFCDGLQSLRNWTRLMIAEAPFFMDDSYRINIVSVNASGPVLIRRTTRNIVGTRFFGPNRRKAQHDVRLIDYEGRIM